jgi:hypothetical protein
MLKSGHQGYVLGQFSETRMTTQEDSTMKHGARVAEKLGLGDVHSIWLAKLEELHSSANLSAPDTGALSALFAQLDVTNEDAAEILETMPSPERDPESWWLLEKSQVAFVHGLASRETQPDWVPLPTLPVALRLFPVHLILVSIAAIRQRQEDFGVPDDISWERSRMSDEQWRHTGPSIVEPESS